MKRFRKIGLLQALQVHFSEFLETPNKNFRSNFDELYKKIFFPIFIADFFVFVWGMQYFF